MKDAKEILATLIDYFFGIFMIVFLLFFIFV